MDYFLKKDNVEKYLDMIGDDYDNTYVINKLREVLKENSTILELGMGGGVDLVEINKYYKAVGSDYSQAFIDKFNQKNTNIKTCVVDAISMDISESFDCIYSNKVLHHLKIEDFKTSLLNQKKHLNDDGIIFMTLWRDDYHEELMDEGNLRFVYYKEEDIEKIVEDDFEIIKIESYDEFDNDDSLLIVLKKK